MKTAFRSELEKLINRESMENGSDTPDFILAEFLTDCLDLFDRTVRAREKWYGREAQTVPSYEAPKDAIPKYPCCACKQPFLLGDLTFIERERKFYCANCLSSQLPPPAPEQVNQLPQHALVECWLCKGRLYRHQLKLIADLNQYVCPACFDKAKSKSRPCKSC